MTDAHDTDRYPTQPLSLRDQAGQDRGTQGEEIVTPLPHAYVPINAATDRTPDRRPSRLLGILVGIALALGLASLALNLIFVSSAWRVQRTGVRGLDSAIRALDTLAGEGFHYDYRFERTVPISSSVPFRQNMVFPFSGEIPINTEVQVPIDAGILGKFMVNVPISTSVQIDTEVPISVDETFDISTSIPVSMVIPIDVRADDPEIQDKLSGLRAWLMDLRNSLDVGLTFPLPGK